MGIILKKISSRLAGYSKNSKSKKRSKSCSEPGSDFSQILVDQVSSRQSSSERSFSEEQHQEARRQVFEKIVSETLNSPKHPCFYLLSDQVRCEMGQAIADQLVHSHFLR